MTKGRGTRPPSDGIVSTSMSRRAVLQAAATAAVAAIGSGRVGNAIANPGQAAWIYDKFHAWTDNNGDPESALTRDEMLDNITLYWLTETAASSARIYFEHAGVGGNAGVVDIPVGCSVFPLEIVPAPRRWAERFYPHLIYWNELDRGGHFAAFEQPVLFTRELRDRFRSLR